jgi:DNA-binding CsgD family transcriptional regulator
MVQAGEEGSGSWGRLSERERAVVAGVAAGKTNRAIAGELGIAVSTVASHLRGVRRKLDGKHRIDLVREWAAATRTDDAVPSSGRRLATLTAAEREVMRGVLAGKTNADIAAERGTATRTVANQVARIFKKMGVRSRAGLARRWLAG